MVWRKEILTDFISTVREPSETKPAPLHQSIFTPKLKRKGKSLVVQGLLELATILKNSPSKIV
jgi:hypothetical protein